ncbi:nitroreductase family protein [Clostridium akagii]|uniref:nitroreductase family protein n=1 Tax=Clostridium akagii TaxID=91623 RepID=UPI00047B5147|nr:nitroreductase family protein [Clostridium akagii]
MSIDLSKSIMDVIKYRTSIRTYDNKPLSEDIKAKLQNRMDNVSGPFNEKVRFEIIDKFDKSNENIKLGTYGVIKGVSSFIVTSIEKNDEALEQLGYILENIVLYATSIGVGTVWLGGTFNKGEFAKVIDSKDNEIMPIVLPIGIPAEKRSFTEKMMRLVSGGKNRKIFNDIVFSEDFTKKLDESKAGEYAKPLEMVRLAPSASNKQPWRIVVDNSGFHFFLNHTKGYNSMGFDMEKIDMGIAMYHFEASAKELNLSGHWSKEFKHIKNTPKDTEFIISWLKE